MKKRMFSFLVFSILFTGCGNSSSSNGKIFQNETPMPLSYDNIIEFTNKLDKANKSKPLGMNQSNAIKYLYIDTMDGMGYSFESTMLEVVKAVSNAKANSQTLYLVTQVFSPLINVLAESDDIVADSTRDKLAIYNKYRYIRPHLIESLKLIRKCENSYNAKCTKEQYMQILSDSNFIDVSEIKKRIEDTTGSYIRGAAAYSFLLQINDSTNLPAFDKFTITRNGNLKGIKKFFEQGKGSIELTKEGLQAIELYDPWWIN